ncbi:hypothetical protein [Paenibacillus sp. FJAT-26967]|uniref:hypothetical protein n=1 Tax=Paenibacillus sp. FJAT-26967 TaxID=1729690 RepID=UPI0012E344AB|nr:hypothetical protein [Paenibacillus sp. FJAT-26967]
MNKLGIVFTSFGLFFIALGSWEKIFLFSTSPSEHMQLVRNNIPSEIWNITSYTLYSGIFLFALGVLIVAATRRK